MLSDTRTGQQPVSQAQKTPADAKTSAAEPTLLYRKPRTNPSPPDASQLPSGGTPRPRSLERCKPVSSQQAPERGVSGVWRPVINQPRPTADVMQGGGLRTPKGQWRPGSPHAGAPSLSLGELDPEIQERLAAEMIKRRPNLGAHLYGDVARNSTA